MLITILIFVLHKSVEKLFMETDVARKLATLPRKYLHLNITTIALFAKQERSR